MSDTYRTNAAEAKPAANQLQFDSLPERAFWENVAAHMLTDTRVDAIGTVTSWADKLVYARRARNDKFWMADRIDPMTDKGFTDGGASPSKIGGINGDR